MIEQFSVWLSQTSLSQLIQTTSWAIPLTQTIHILAVSFVMASMLLLDLRLLRVSHRTQSVSVLARRFLPWTWRMLILLLLSGAILVIGEPERELLNTAFRAKMLMVITVSLLTWFVQNRLKQSETYWETKKFSALMIGFVSLLLWIAIVTAGRWIAYI